MAEIRFKATRRKHDSGFRVIEKSGDLQFDFDPHSNDGIWLYGKDGRRLIIIDCKMDGTFRILFDGKGFGENIYNRL